MTGATEKREYPVSVKVSIEAYQALKRQAKEKQITVSDILHPLIMQHLAETGALHT